MGAFRRDPPPDQTPSLPVPRPADGAIYVVHGDALTVTFCGQRRELLPAGNFPERLTAS